MRDKRVKQCFCSSKLLDIGKTQMDYQGVNISLYNLERLMIELVRHKDKIPYDYYKEVVHSFRQRIYEIDIEKIQEYIPMFPPLRRGFSNE